MNHTLRTLWLSASIATAATVAIVTSFACGAPSTSGERIVLETRLTGGSDVEKPFTNAFGWEIRISKLAVSVGSFVYFSGDPVLAERERARPWRPLYEFVLGTAHAHPGHYQEGTALGEMLVPGSYDLSAGALTLPQANAVTGSYRSARFAYQAPPVGAAAAELGTSVVIVEGSAAKGALSTRFRLEGSSASVADDAGRPIVSGCSFAAADIQHSGTVTVTVRPSVWLDQAEFDEQAASSSTIAAIAPTTRLYRAFERGLREARGYEFAYRN